ncbi:MAG: tyrosine-type recombinase/integrase [Candidatus Latescibacteria bacterium]|nr:tyrosine-type recombinase/integrase [Candidatus Latescibacterota bacterium]
MRKLGLKVSITKLRFHDLKHVFCTWLLREGVSIDVIRELAGHLDRRTTDRDATLDRMDMGKYLSHLPEIKTCNRREVKAV